MVLVHKLITMFNCEHFADLLFFWVWQLLASSVVHFDCVFEVLQDLKKHELGELFFQKKKNLTSSFLLSNKKNLCRSRNGPLTKPALLSWRYVWCFPDNSSARYSTRSYNQKVKKLKIEALNWNFKTNTIKTLHLFAIKTKVVKIYKNFKKF